jgi:hypothetical protein
MIGLIEDEGLRGRALIVGTHDAPGAVLADDV